MKKGTGKHCSEFDEEQESEKKTGGVFCTPSPVGNV